MKLSLVLGTLLLACGPTWAQFGGAGGFGGSSLGAEGKTDSGGVGSADIGFVPWLSVNGIYNHRLGAIPIDQKADQMSGTFSGGIGGSKMWRNSQLQAGYIGSGSYNNVYSLNNAVAKWRQTHVANLGFAKDLTQRWQVGLSAVGGLSDGGYGVGSAFGATGIPGLGGSIGATGGSTSGDLTFQDPAQNGLVDNELSGARVKFGTARGAVAYRLTQRLSVNGTAGAAIARRTSLSGVNGYSGGGGINYQLTQRTQIGGSYNRSNVDYVGLFGGVHYDTLQVGLQHDVNQNMTVLFQVGGARLNSTYIGTTALPPDLAALLGVSSTMEVQKVQNNALSGRFQLTYTGHDGSFSVGYNRGMAPGNGVVYASIRDVATIGYGRKITQNLGLSFNAAYTRMSGKVVVMKVTETAQGGAMASYRLYRGLSLTAQGGYRYTNIVTVQQRRDIYAGFGLAWRPGDAAFVF